MEQHKRALPVCEQKGLYTHIQPAAGHWGSRLTPVWLGRFSVLLSLWAACGSQVVNPVEKRVFIQTVRATVSGIKSMFWKSDIATVGLYSFLLVQFSGKHVLSISLASVILPVKQRKYSLFLKRSWDNISQSTGIMWTGLILHLIRSLPQLFFSLHLTSKVKMPSMPFKDTGNKNSVGFTAIWEWKQLCAAYWLIFRLWLAHWYTNMHNAFIIY